MKISDLFNREFKIMVIKMLIEVRKQYMKKMLFQQTENIKKSEDSLRDLWDTIKWINICIRVSQNEKTERKSSRGLEWFKDYLLNVGCFGSNVGSNALHFDIPVSWKELSLPNSFTFQGEMTVVMWSLWFRSFRKVQLSHHPFLFPAFSLVSELSGHPVIRRTILKRALNLKKIQVQVSALLPTSFCPLFNPSVPQRSYLKTEVIISTLQNCNKDEIRLCERAF